MYTIDFATVSPFVAIGLFALVHASFQLGMSVLTLLSGHSLGKKRSLHRTLILNLSYIVGVVVTTFLLLVASAYFWQTMNPQSSDTTMKTLAALSIAIGCIVMVGYYRRGRGTMLWVPRNLADYLSSRAKHTRNGFEALSLGATTVMAELPFTMVVIISVAYLTQLPSISQISLITWYSVIVSTPLLVVTTLLAGGHRLSTIQKWRESNKIFLQSAAAVGLFVVALYMVVSSMRGGV